MFIKNQPIQEKKKPEISVKAKCEKCSKRFKLKSCRLKYKSVTNEVKVLYYKCPHCKTKFAAGWKNEEIDLNLERMKEISNEINKNPKDAEVLHLKWKNLKERNLVIMENLNSIYGQEVFND